MGIWIRSQDKNKNIFSTGQIIKPLSGKFHIFDISDKNMYYVLGVYSTEEQALKVLDEIDEIIKPKMIIKFNSILSKQDLKNFEERTGNIAIDNQHDIMNIPTVAFYKMPEDIETI